jgi:hypothetical protein
MHAKCPVAGAMHVWVETPGAPLRIAAVERKADLGKEVLSRIESTIA